MECRLLHFCTDDYILILSGFSSCTFLYGWLPSHFEWIFVMYISVRMTTFSFWMDFRHVHFCTDNYILILNGFSSCTCLYEWLSASFWFDCCHARFCANDYHFILNGLLSCTFLYGWLPSLFEWIYVMHILCNDFPYSFGFPWYSANTL